MDAPDEEALFEGRIAQQFGERQEEDPTMREFGFKILTDLVSLCENLTEALNEMGAEVPPDYNHDGVVNLEGRGTTIRARELDELCTRVSLRIRRLTDACDSAHATSVASGLQPKRASRRLQQAECVLQHVQTELHDTEQAHAGEDC